MVAPSRKKLITSVVTLLAVAAGTFVPDASADPTFGVMNAAGGIYWRSAPDWNTPVAQPGNGFYDGTTVAVHCYQSGTPVPGSADTMWEQATVVAGPGTGSGWINEHFINDGSAINQPSPGVPPCNASAPPPPPGVVPAVRITPATPSEQVLSPDPDLWCVAYDSHRYDTQVREADWKVVYKGLVGTPHQNDWKCSYLVAMTVPNSKGDVGYLPPITQNWAIDFNAMCKAEFPGSHLQYMLGPVWTTPWPWECIGQAGRYYPPPELQVTTVLRDGGFEASGVPARSAGSLGLRLTASLSKGRVAAAARAVVIAKGTRSVAASGRYKLRVNLTRSGRALLRHARRLSVTFTLRFAPTFGAPVTRSTHVVLRR